VRLVDLAGLVGKTCLIVGGRQSAFEWAALAAESGVERVHVSYRHATPRFAEADWGWVDPLLARFDTEPRWYHELPAAGREEITRHMWRIGREQLEPWLAPRIDRPEVSLWPDSRPARAYSDVDGRSLVILDNGTELVVDMVLLATGYRMDVNRLPFLTAGSSLGGVDVVDGFPVLDERFSSSVPGLYFTNRFATRDFGHFFDFTAGVRVSARTIASSILAGVPEAAR
jgi:hypothetical protein